MAEDPGSLLPEPPYVRVMGRITDRHIAPIDRLRAKAVQRLRLQPGDRVIDAGCGNGASLPRLLQKIGPSGAVVGIEIAASMAARARQHVHEDGWTNVEIIEDSAESAALDGEFDALLLFGAHEIVTSTAALDHLFGHLKIGARVANFGAKLVRPPLGWLVNPMFHRLSAKWLPTSPPIDAQPWRLLSERLSQVQVEQRVGGLMYLLSGQK